MLFVMWLVVDVGNMFGEGIVWCDCMQLLYWIDILYVKLYCWYFDSGILQIWDMFEWLVLFVLCEDDGWLLFVLVLCLVFF